MPSETTEASGRYAIQRNVPATSDSKQLVTVMRKIAILLAVALMSAPLISALPTPTYAAAKAKKAVRTAAPKESATEVDPAEANSRFARALGDLFYSLGTYRYVPPGFENEDARTARAEVVRPARPVRRPLYRERYLRR